MNATVVPGMAEGLYRAHLFDSQSQFKAGRNVTDAHMQYELANPKKPTESMINGTCLHALILEGRRIFEIDTKAKIKNPKEQGDGITLSPHNAAIVQGMCDGIMRNPEARRILEGPGEVELSIFSNGMKARIDKMTLSGPSDIKTTSDRADPYHFMKSVMLWGYHIQAPHYLELCADAGLPCEKFTFVVVESFPPYECNVFVLDDESVQQGWKELVELRRRYYECKKTGVYLGYQGVTEIRLPEWKFKGE